MQIMVTACFLRLDSFVIILVPGNKSLDVKFQIECLVLGTIRTKPGLHYKMTLKLKTI